MKSLKAGGIFLLLHSICDFTNASSYSFCNESYRLDLMQLCLWETLPVHLNNQALETHFKQC